VGLGVWVDRIRVGAGALGDGAASCERSARNLADLLDKIDHAVDQLSATWSGQASDQFQAAASVWRAGSRDLHRTLVGIGRLLETAGGNYAAAEQANLSMWGAA
jgi:WXG100 family type VII secretion target